MIFQPRVLFFEKQMTTWFQSGFEEGMSELDPFLKIIKHNYSWFLMHI